MNRCPHRHNLFRVYAATGLLPERARDGLADGGHARLSADKDDIIHVSNLNPGVAHRIQRDIQGTLYVVRDQANQRVAVELVFDGKPIRNVRNVDVHGLREAELALGTLGCLLEAVQRHPVFTKIDAVLVLESVRNPVDHAVIKVFAAEVAVAQCRQDLVDTIRQLQHADVEGSAAEVKNQERAVEFLTKSVGQGRRSRLAQQSLAAETRGLCGIHRRCSLSRIEVRRHRDDGLVDRPPQGALGHFFCRTKHMGADLDGSERSRLESDQAAAVVSPLDVVPDSRVGIFGLR